MRCETEKRCSIVNIRLKQYFIIHRRSICTRANPVMDRSFVFNLKWSQCRYRNDWKKNLVWCHLVKLISATKKENLSFLFDEFSCCVHYQHMQTFENCRVEKLRKNQYLNTERELFGHYFFFFISFSYQNVKDY